MLLLMSTSAMAQGEKKATDATLQKMLIAIMATKQLYVDSVDDTTM